VAVENYAVVGIMMGMVTKKCKTCDKSYKVYAYRKESSHFCSIGCFHTDRMASESYRKKCDSKRKRITKTCESCGSSFWVHYGRRHAARFCCHGCYQDWINNTKEGAALIKKANSARGPMSDELKKKISKSTKDRMKDPKKKAAALASFSKYYETNPRYIQRASEQEKFDYGFSKEWNLISPDGKKFKVRNLMKWAKMNEHLFEDRAPASKHPHWSRIMRGLYLSCTRGTYYCGWLCLSKHSKKMET
jgi:hypothetical protein